MFISLRWSRIFARVERGKAAPHRIQGIGANFVPGIYDASVVDEVMGVPDEEAIRAGRELASTEGLLAGISSGAAVYAARRLAQRRNLPIKRLLSCCPIRANGIYRPNCLLSTPIRWIENTLLI